MSKQLTSAAYDKIVHKLFNERTTIAQKIAAGCARYLGIITDFIRGNDPAEYDKINTAIESIYTVNWPNINIDAASPTECVSHWADIFDELNTLDNNVATAVGILTTTEYLRKAIQQTSTTTVNIYQERSHLFALYDTYRAVNYEMIAMQIDQVGIDADIIRGFALNRAKFNQITAHIMRGVIQDSANDSATIWQLQSRIEDLKDTTLVSGRQTAVPAIMSRFGLVPITRPMNGRSMLEFLGIVDEGDGFDISIEKAVSNNACGAVLVYMGLFNTTQLDFNLSGLIDAEYVLEHDLKTISGTGLTKKVIERLSTINRLKKDVPGTPPRIKICGENRVQYWVIQQLITGDDPLYRLLGHGYICDKPVAVYAPMIAGFLRGYTSRPEDYNEIHADVILSSIYDSEIKTILSAYMVTKLQSPSSDIIRAKIIDQMVEKFINDHRERPMTAKNIRSRAVDVDFISNLLVSVLMPNPTKNYTERVLTAVAKVDSITNVFIHELEKRWMSAVIPDRTFRDYTGFNLIEQIRGIFTNTAGAAIDELERAGTWEFLEPSLKEFYFEYKSDR